MTYVRHRSRMVRQSVWDDLKVTLEDLDWTGSTPLAILNSKPVVLVDNLPEGSRLKGSDISINTLAMDQGTAGEIYEYEMGGLLAQDYLFRFAFFAETEGVALALFQDMQDRYYSFNTSNTVALYDYMQATPSKIVDMEVESFTSERAAEQPIIGMEIFYARLDLVDFLDQE